MLWQGIFRFLHSFSIANLPHPQPLLPRGEQEHQNDIEWDERLIFRAPLR